MDIDGDAMELGDSGLIPIKDGWLYDPESGNTKSPEGRVYDKFGDLIWDENLDPDDEEYRDDPSS